MSHPSNPRIDQVSLYLCKIKTSGFNYSRWENRENYSLLYEIRAADKIGWGESTCKYGALGMARRFARSLIGKNPSLLENLLDPPLVNHTSAYHWLVGIDRRRRQIREGYSIALHDLVGKLQGKSIYRLLNRSPTRDQAALMPVIHVNSVQTMVECAQAWTSEGFRYLKIKLSGEPAHDTQAVAAIKSACPEANILIVDANHGYRNIKSACQAAIAFKELGATYLQNPFRGSVAAYRQLHDQTKIALTADSMAYWPKVRQVLNSGAAQLVNLHPNLMGGIDNLFRVVDFAARKGVAVIIGSSGWMGIQDRAYQKIAFMTDLNYPSEDFGLNPYFQGARAKFYCCEGGLPEVLAAPPDIRSGVIYDRPEEHGFGIDVDRDLIKKFLQTHWLFE